MVPFADFCERAQAIICAERGERAIGEGGEEVFERAMDIMTKQVVTASPQMRVSDLIGLLADRRISGVPVVVLSVTINREQEEQSQVHLDKNIYLLKQNKYLILLQFILLTYMLLLNVQVDYLWRIFIQLFILILLGTNQFCVL